MAQDGPRSSRRICLIGAECTGKTTLAAILAGRFDGIAIPEYAREYAEQVGRELTYEDVEPIARGQLALCGPGLSPAYVAIFDTDLISTVVYSRHHYGDCPTWIVDEARVRRAELYLLLDVDVPWEADGVRDSGARREQLHEEFVTTLQDFDANVVTISGGWEERVARAIAVVESWLRER